MLAEITLVGYLADKPKVEFSGGKKYASMRIATDFYKKVGQNPEKYTMWHTVFIHNQFMVDKCEWLNKGDLVYSRGSLRYNEFKREDGSTLIAPFQTADKIKLIKKGTAHLEEDKNINDLIKQEENNQRSSKALFETEAKVYDDYTGNPFNVNEYDEDLPF